MADGYQGLAPPDDSGANAQGSGAVVRHLAAGTGLDGNSDGGGAGTGPNTIGRWAAAFGEGGPAALIFEQTGGSPLGETQQAELKAAVQELPEQAGIELSNWYWKVVRQFVSERFGIELSRSSIRV